MKVKKKQNRHRIEWRMKLFRSLEFIGNDFICQREKQRLTKFVLLNFKMSLKKNEVRSVQYICTNQAELPF